MRVHFVARIVFGLLFLLSMTNALGLYITYVRNVVDERYMLGVYPITFAVCAAIILAFTRGRQHSTILMAGWFFWLVFFLGGFLGSQQITATYVRATLEVVVKPWITLVGVPWLALRAISEDRVPRFLRATVVIAAIGAVLGVLQLVFPGFLQQLSDNSDRATGFWINPNNCGIICAIALFISLMCPFQQRPLNWIVRLLLIAGVAASFSRSAILALVVGWVVYGIATKRIWKLVKSLIMLILFVVGMLMTLEVIEAVSPAQAERLKFVRAFLEGDWAANKSDNRTDLWKQTFLAIESKGGLLFGLGHGSTLRIVETSGGGVAPHNYYLSILGNSGIFALIALLAYQVILFQQAWKCTRREAFAGLLAIAVVLTLHHMFDHSLLNFPFSGVIVACIALGVVYGRPRELAAARVPRPIPVPYPNRSNGPMRNPSPPG
jgi:O-antigen ligase